MPHLTGAHKTFFKENGYLVVPDLLTPGQIEDAQKALWTGIEADREEPESWINAEPRTPIQGSHPAIMSTLFDSPVAAMMEELVGPALRVFDGPNPAMVYPSGDDNWSPPRGHLDGYYTPTNSMAEGTVKHNTICVTIYVSDVELQGGCFAVWPGSHVKAAEYFKAHSLLSLQGGSGDEVMELGEGVQIAGRAGTACLWHGQMFHSGTRNCSRHIRMGLLGRYARGDANDICFETPDDPWEYWEGID